MAADPMLSAVMGTHMRHSQKYNVEEKPGAGSFISRFKWILFMSNLCAFLVINSQ